MKQNIMKYIDILEGYKSYIKNCHWSAKNMSEHKLCDEIADTISENQDEIAEIAQGLFGQIKMKELKPKGMNFSSTKELLKQLINDTNKFYKSINGDKFIGMRSVVEAFLGELNKYQYLIDLCLKEDINRRLKSNLTERKQILLNDKELHSIIRESINNVLKRL